MKVLLTLVVIAVVMFAVIYWIGQPRDTVDAPLSRAFARAKGYYVNETNADYRRARLEIAQFAEQLGDSVAFHLDVALIDLQEINYRVQDQDVLLPESDYDRLLRSAQSHLERARAIDPDNDSVAYNLARAYVKLAPGAENADELYRAAERLLRPLTKEDPPDPSTLLIFGGLLQDRNDHEGALAAYTHITDLGDDYVPEGIYFVALSKKAQILMRSDIEQGKALRKEIARRFPGDKPKTTDAALERGRYTRFLELTEAPKTRADPRRMQWARVTSRAGVPPAGNPRFFLAPDLDDDCARDLVMNGTDGLRVLRNRRNATFQDLTKEAGFPAGFVVTAAAAGDLNGDEACDLVLGGPQGLRLFINITDEDNPNAWRFVDATQLKDGRPRFGERGAEAVLCLALWDFDHDGDLDVFAGGARNRLYRTAVEQPIAGGKVLRFNEMAQKLGLHEPAASDALILDAEDDQDVDLLVTGDDGNAWFENQRQLRFARRELPAGARLGAADVDNDLREEVRIGQGVHKWSGGAWSKLGEGPALLDLDGDGVVDPDPFAGLEPTGAPLRAVGADLNRNGSRDLLLLTDAGLELYVSSPTQPVAWVDFRPRGLKTNEFGIGTRLQLFAGDLRIGATCRDGLVSFGLGKRTVIDALLLRWTNGVEQGVVTPALTTCNLVEEREGEVGSCPFLYAFDGSRWHFINDCHSGTPLGLPVADGVYLSPRPNETVFIPGDRLRPVDGRLRLDLAEEFRELFYVDHVVLRAIDHPADARPVLNEGFKVTTVPEFRVYSLADLRPPRAARDQAGRDILPLVRARDGRHAVVWEELDSRYVGLAREWSIELDFGDLTQARRVLLVMDGWVEFPTASASIAASQSETVHFKPPVIEAIGPDGQWQVAEPDPGFPAGKGKAVLVDLTGKIPTKDGRLRITSTQRLHWDAFSISTGADRPLRLTKLPLLRADLGFRGVGKRVEDPAGEQPWRYSHDDLETFYRWDQVPAGMLTRYGDVRELLEAIDDRYPILATGDTVELEFDAAALPPLPEGWVRDFCFTTEGWVKDADMNQAVRERVGPLPFHAMSGYPYDEARERHPHPGFARAWLTRPSRRLVDRKALK